eukprot:11217960-Lingulodinium_polyedra.AAC.1
MAPAVVAMNGLGPNRRRAPVETDGLDRFPVAGRRVQWLRRPTNAARNFATRGGIDVFLPPSKRPCCDAQK